MDDKAHFTRLWPVASAKVAPWLMRMVGEEAEVNDLLQDAGEWAWMHRDEFSDWDSYSAFTAWYWAIVKNRLRTFWRTKARRNARERGIENLDDQPTPGDSVEARLATAEAARDASAVARAEGVSERDIEILNLYAAGCSHAEIASEMEISSVNSAKVVSRALDRIREAMHYTQDPRLEEN